MKESENVIYMHNAGLNDEFSRGFLSLQLKGKNLEGGLLMSSASQDLFDSYRFTVGAQDRKGIGQTA